jgi:photosystem II stability/assembly factor-like uncharacterized protein
MTRRALAIVAAACAFSAGAHSIAFTDVSPDAASYIGKVALHPLQPRRLMIAATGGVRTSDDGGATWGRPTLLEIPERMFAHRGRPGLVFLQTMGESTFAAGVLTRRGGETFRSTDFGMTWARVHAGTADGERAHSPFASDPGKPDRIYATIRSPVLYGPGTLFFRITPTDLTLALSEDAGLTWRAVEALPLPQFAAMSGMAAAEGPVPAAPKRLFFAHQGLGMVKSEDGGGTWTSVPAPARDFYWLKQDYSRGEVLYGFDGRNVVRSDDGGGRWQAIFETGRQFLKIDDHPAVVVDPARTGRLWLIGLEAGVFLSEDRGASWTNVGFGAVIENGFPRADTIVRELVASPDDAAQVYLVWRGRLYRGAFPSSGRVAVEYTYGDRFWLTGDPGEALFMDFRADAAVRSGERFGLWGPLDAPAGAIGLCRFQGNPARGQSSRFLTLEGGECDALRGFPDWVLEGEREYFAMPPGPAGCAPGLVSVARFFNDARPHNHRYVANTKSANEMRARGWIEEGVAFCARPLGENE